MKNRLICWWYGHNFTGGIDCDPVCSCSAPFTYESAIWGGAWKELKQWFDRRTSVCSDCGKRLGCHNNCIPF